jgi:hypothetical protein
MNVLSKLIVICFALAVSGCVKPENVDQTPKRTVAAQQPAPTAPRGYRQFQMEWFQVHHKGKSVGCNREAALWGYGPYWQCRESYSPSDRAQVHFLYPDNIRNQFRQCGVKLWFVEVAPGVFEARPDRNFYRQADYAYRHLRVVPITGECAERKRPLTHVLNSTPRRVTHTTVIVFDGRTGVRSDPGSYCGMYRGRPRPCH